MSYKMGNIDDVRGAGTDSASRHANRRIPVRAPRQEVPYGQRGAWPRRQGPSGAFRGLGAAAAPPPNPLAVLQKADSDAAAAMAKVPGLHAFIDMHPSPPFYREFTRDLKVRPVSALINLFRPFENIAFDTINNAISLGGLTTLNIAPPPLKPVNVRLGLDVPAEIKDPTVRETLKRWKLVQNFMILSYMRPQFLAAGFVKALVDEARRAPANLAVVMQAVAVLIDSIRQQGYSLGTVNRAAADTFTRELVRGLKVAFPTNPAVQALTAVSAQAEYDTRKLGPVLSKLAQVLARTTTPALAIEIPAGRFGQIMTLVSDTEKAIAEARSKRTGEPGLSTAAYNTTVKALTDVQTAKTRTANAATAHARGQAIVDSVLAPVTNAAGAASGAAGAAAGAATSLVKSFATRGLAGLHEDIFTQLDGIVSSQSTQLRVREGDYRIGAAPAVAAAGAPAAAGASVTTATAVTQASAPAAAVPVTGGIGAAISAAVALAAASAIAAGGAAATEYAINKGTDVADRGIDTSINQGEQAAGVRSGSGGAGSGAGAGASGAGASGGGAGSGAGSSTTKVDTSTDTSITASRAAQQAAQQESSGGNTGLLLAAGGGLLALALLTRK